jgi:hypothetical protein
MIPFPLLVLSLSRDSAKFLTFTLYQSPKTRHLKMAPTPVLLLLLLVSPEPVEGLNF